MSSRNNETKRCRRMLLPAAVLLCGLSANAAMRSGDAAAGEVVLDTGRIKVVCGREGGGFVDEAFLDLNGDGKYAESERVSLRPADKPGLLVSYSRLPAGYVPGSVVSSAPLVGAVKNVKAKLDGLKATITGVLDFGTAGTAPFEVVIQGEKSRATLTVAASFAPLAGKNELALREAGLRIYCFFPKVKGKRRVYTSSPWAYGGHLIESPWYWREWVSWGRNCGPLTTKEGRVPPGETAFYLQDEVRGIQAAVKEPAAAAPFELFGDGNAATLTVYAWSPRAKPYLMSRQTPKRFFWKNVRVHFFKAGRGRGRWKAVSSSLKELRAGARPLASNLRDPRFTPELFAARVKELQAAAKRGWAAEIAATVPPNDPVMTSTTPVSGKGWIKLELDAPYSQAVKGAPARGGVPFPRGVLKAAKNIRLLDAGGRELPCQVERTAVWPDGSVKWVLVTTFTDAAPGKKTTYKLEYGPEIVRKAAPKKPLILKEAADGAAGATGAASVTVDTGVLRFTVSKNGQGLFDAVWLDADGDGKYSEAEKVVGTDQTARRNVMDFTVFKNPSSYAFSEYHGELLPAERSTVEVEKISVERRGPLTARIGITGKYRYRTLGRGRERGYKNHGCEFWTWLTVYAGKPYVEVQHAYVFEGNPNLEAIGNLNLSFKPRLDGAAVFTSGGDGRVFFTSLKSNQGRAGLSQNNPHAFEFWAAETPSAPTTVTAAGHAAAGWADLSDGKRGVTFGIREMRERYAKALTVENGRVFARLWPKRAPPLDTRRYSRWFGNGESHSKGLGVAEGVSRSHDVFFYFHTGSAKESRAAATAQIFLKPAYLKAYPAWYAGTRAAGVFHPYDAKKFPKWESVLRDGLDYMLYHQRLWSWFGHYDYGDFQQRPAGGGAWQKLNGRWGWANNEALLDMWVYEQFMRTGRRDYLKAALAMSRHVEEVDLIHTTQYKHYHSFKMRGHRHNVNHWGDGYVGVRVAAAQGFRLGWFLTGNVPIRHNLGEILPAMWRKLAQSDSNDGAPLGILVFFWEATGGQQYYNCLKAYVDFQVAHYRKFGTIRWGGWNYRTAEFNGKLGDKPWGGPPVTFFYQNFGGAYSVMEMAELMKRQDLVEALLRFARDSIRERGRTWEGRYCHLRLLAFAYRHSGDRAFLKQAVEKANSLSVPSDRGRWAYVNGLNSFTGKVSMLGWACQGLPYLMAAVEEMKDYPTADFQSPAVLRLPLGKTVAALSVDGSSSKAAVGKLAKYEWTVDGKPTAEGSKATFSLKPGAHAVRLTVTDDKGRRSSKGRRLFVWEPGTVVQLGFAKVPLSFVKCGSYNDKVGYGYLPGCKASWTNEGRYYGGKGCREIYLAGTVQIKTGPGTFEVEMGGTDYWSFNYGPVFVQGKQVVKPLDKPAKNRKVSWGWKGETVVGADGLLKVRFGRTAKKEPAVIAYIIVREKKKGE